MHLKDESVLKTESKTIAVGADSGEFKVSYLRLK